MYVDLVSFIIRDMEIISFLIPKIVISHSLLVDAHVFSVWSKFCHLTVAFGKVLTPFAIFEEQPNLRKDFSLNRFKQNIDAFTIVQ